MSKSLNIVAFTGYLGADPRVHTFDDGSRIANLRVAIGRQKQQDGEWVDDSVWVDVAVRAYEGRTGAVDAIENYLAKGSFVAVEGQLAQPREWTDNQGQARFTIVIDHASVSFGPRVDAGSGGPPAQQAQPRQAAMAGVGRGSLGSDDDIPFDR